MNISNITVDGNEYGIKDSFGRDITVEEFEEGKSYSVGDLVQHEGLIYQCIEASSGIWDNVKWKQVYLTDFLGGGSGEQELQIEQWDEFVDFLQNKTLLSFYEDRFPGGGIRDCAFNGCSSLTSVSFPNCTSIGVNAFYGCSSLTSISFPNCITIGYQAFYGCSSLTLVSFPSCTTIGYYAFYGCSSLTSVSFPNCTTIGNSVFYNCSSLTSVSFPNCTTIGSSAFCRCLNLTSVSFPNCTTIEGPAFYFCSNLTSVYLLASSVCTLQDRAAFYNTPISKSTYTGSFGSIYVPSSLVSAYKTATNWVRYSSRITSYRG